MEGFSTTTKAMLAEISSYVPIASGELASKIRAAFPSELSRARVPRVMPLPPSPLGLLYTVLTKPLLEHNVARVDPFILMPVSEGFWQLASVNAEFTRELEEWIRTEKKAARFIHAELTTEWNFRKKFTKATVDYIDQMFFKANFHAKKSA